MFCINCGEKIDDEALYCPNCGKKVETEIQKTVTKKKTIPKKCNSKLEGITVIHAGLILFFGSTLAILVGFCIWFSFLPGNVFKNPDYKYYKQISDGEKLIRETKENNVQRIFYIAVFSKIDKETLKKALDIAVEMDSMKAVKLLVRLGANPNADVPALIYARNLNMAELLVKLGADVNAKCDDGWTALHTAAYNNNLEIATFLVIHGIDINARTEYSQTALFYAARYNNIETATFLINSGSDINSRTWEGETPLMSAAFNNSYDLANILISAGADVNARMDTGLTALMIASSNSLEIARLLINAGADVNVRDIKGKTAFDYAKDNKTMIQILRGY